MEKILYMTKVFPSSICFLLLPTDVAWDNIFLFFSCLIIALAHFLGKMAPVTSIIGEISLLFSVMDNDLLHASGNSPADKILERINFALSHAHLYLSESYYERDDKSAATNILDISCGDGGSSSSLSDINVFILATSNVVCC